MNILINAALSPTLYLAILNPATQFYPRLHKIMCYLSSPLSSILRYKLMTSPSHPFYRQSRYQPNRALAQA